MSIDPDTRPLVILSPAPQRRDRIFTAEALARLHERYRVVDLEKDAAPGRLDAALPESMAIVGQPDLPAERLARAPGLRALLNVEGNFFPNVDYDTCYRRGIAVLGCGPAYSQAVAEYAVGLAIDLARGISREDRAFREGRERWVSAGNLDAILLRGSAMGFLGFGNIGRALLPLVLPYAPSAIRAYDPWLPDSVLLNEDEWNALIPDFLNQWEPDKRIVVYCGGGGCQASKAVAARLRTELQLENVHVLKGGLKAWRSE